MLVLASGSAARTALLTAAGVAHDVMVAQVDEDSAKQAFKERGLQPRDIADGLAELKAVKVSQRRPEALVLGADQILAAEDGGLLDKPGSREEAADQLRSLRGKDHVLISSAVIALGGQPIWRAVDEARLTVRNFSDSFLKAYLDHEWPAISGCVGGYRLEAMGAQLFSRIRGDHFTILGLPLLPVLDFLRVRGELTS
ncbi:septum formation protein Maf [Tardibacter chloracetimidivorans]|uniref:Nucleoside triphosphate pyrophosphatase n=1 Tax=Tardibacter chloracetimidivorans TaxID=1921510 RepID=A0A1L3ZWS6_9SPHN|nr:Maf family protein [Tardibacter chloracetimidivorans]API60078.1 septum formation protein Maf [Tardibacter chloracetimidivorans]